MSKAGKGQVFDEYQGDEGSLGGRLSELLCIFEQKHKRAVTVRNSPVTSELHTSATVTGFSTANPSEDSNIRPRYFWLRRVTITVPV